MDDLDHELIDELNGESVSVPGKYPTVPSDLNEEQKQLWRKVIRSKPWDWFDSSNLPLLKNYIITLWQMDKVVEAVNKCLSELEIDSSELKKLTQVQNQLSGRATDLATKMRLTQSSLIQIYKASKGPKVIEGETIDNGKPWEMGLPLTPGQRREFDNEN